jgi:GntR family transcriptional repressor for pyruvate dehydrogenase complex
MVGKLSVLKPLRPQRNLAQEVTERLAGDIRRGRLAPGSKLPTEQEMTEALGVSRTVVREAVAALRAEGLVSTRQGSGAYVTVDQGARPFRIDPSGLSSIGDVIDVMELRLAVEVEAAALAGERASAKQVAQIRQALTALDEAIEKGDGAVAEDVAFHRSIAEATGNAQYPLFLEFLGRHVIPRQSVRVEIDTAEQQRDYLTRIQKEHRRIFVAIAARDSTEARRAMREHLRGSLQRYRKLAARRDGAPKAKGATHA